MVKQCFESRDYTEGRRLHGKAPPGIYRHVRANGSAACFARASPRNTRATLNPSRLPQYQRPHRTAYRLRLPPGSSFSRAANCFRSHSRTVTITEQGEIRLLGRKEDIAEAGFVHVLPIVMNNGVMHRYVVLRHSGQFKAPFNHMRIDH